MAGQNLTPSAPTLPSRASLRRRSVANLDEGTNTSGTAETYSFNGARYAITPDTPQEWIDADANRPRKKARTTSKRSNDMDDPAKKTNSTANRISLSKQQQTSERASNSTGDISDHHNPGVAVADQRVPPIGSTLRMIHREELVRSDGRHEYWPSLSSQIRKTLDSGCYIKLDSPIHEFGGVVANVSFAGSSRAVMLCDQRKCDICETSEEDSDAGSPTNGLPFIHPHQCIISDYKLLEYEHEESGSGAPCEAGQKIKAQNVLIEVPGGVLKVHTCAVCVMSECADCKSREGESYTEED